MWPAASQDAEKMIGDLLLVFNGPVGGVGHTCPNANLLKAASCAAGHANKPRCKSSIWGICWQTSLTEFSAQPPSTAGLRVVLLVADEILSLALKAKGNL